MKRNKKAPDALAGNHGAREIFQHQNNTKGKKSQIWILNLNLIKRPKEL